MSLSHFPSRSLTLFATLAALLLGLWSASAFPQDRSPLVTNPVGMRLLLVPGGRFLLGSPPQEAGRYWNEGPQHWVRLAPFYMSATEVTNAQYGRFVAATGHTPPVYWLDKNLNAPQQPVVGVTYYDAVAFTAWLSRTTGDTYRLPTEAEWEVAARGGLRAEPFPWGSEPPDAGGRYRANYYPGDFAADGFRLSAPVGRFPPNGYGLFDVAGNVAEWCLDFYSPSFYNHAPETAPTGPATGQTRILRGGSWYSRARDLRCATRQSAPPASADGFIGFRVVRLLKPSLTP